MNETWELVKTFYRDTFGVPAIIVEYMAVYDILVMAASGIPNNIIAFDTEVSTKDVRDTIEEYFNFGGWDVFQKVNYWFVFNYTTCIEEFKQIIHLNPENGTIGISDDVLYFMCVRLNQIKEALNEWNN